MNVRALRELKHLEWLKAKGSRAVTRSSSSTWLTMGTMQPTELPSAHVMFCLRIGPVQQLS